MSAQSQRIQEIEEKINTLKAQWPAHSVKAWMLQQLEDLEEELARLKTVQRNDKNQNG
ncbi:MAG: histidine kinase [Anaerolineales bacterium]|nr:histidine kinase [Chloroflexota bacterium]MBL6983696.1 histidine kinase [Anaerolineales bacterium]